MMTLWCMFRSPLMVGAELTKMDDWTLSLLTNEDLLALLDENCKGTQIERTDKVAIWKNKNIKDSSMYVALFNLDDNDATISVSLSDLDEDMDVDAEYSLYEIWDKSRFDIGGGVIGATVPAHGVKVYKMTSSIKNS